MDDFYCNQILTESIIVKKVIETENVLAFYHTNPKWPVHIVIIPKHHTESLLDFLNDQSESLVEMMSVIRQVVEQVTMQCGGCRLTTNFGKYQITKHLHWHVYVSDEMMNNNNI